jgi:hypothetical protein
MAKNHPETIPAQYDADAYARGWNHGHGLACHNVPDLGATIWCDALGRVTVDAENVREVHEALCYEAESNSRDYSPFEFTAHGFNESEDSEHLWESFEAGTAAAIEADLADYSDADYGIES